MADAPEMYRIQCQFYMFVCQIDEWDLGACCGGNSYIQHTLGADPFLYDEFIKVGKEFNEELSYLIEKGADEALEKYKKLLTEKDEENDNDIQACIPMGSPEKNSGDTTA